MKIYEKFKLLDKTKKNAVDREIAIMKKVDHENIVKLKEVITTNKEVSNIYIYKTHDIDYNGICKRNFTKRLLSALSSQDMRKGM